MGWGGGITSSKENSAPGVSLEALLGVPRPLLFLWLSHHEKGISDGREIVQQGSQAVAVRHDLPPNSIVRHVAVESKKSEEEMTCRGESKLFHLSRKFQDISPWRLFKENRGPLSRRNFCLGQVAIV